MGFKTCRLLSGNVRNRELTIIQRRILRRLRNKKRSIKRKIYPRENLNSYIQSQTTRKLPLFHGDLLALLVPLLISLVFLGLDVPVIVFSADSDLFTYTSDMLEDSASSGRSSSTSAVNQPLPGEQAMPPANPAGEQAGPDNPEVPEDPSEIIGGDSIESIKSRLLQSRENPSPEEIRIAEYNAEDLFQVKVEIIRGMTPLDPEGDWPGRGARALDNPRTSTGEDSIENLYRLRDGLLSGDAEIITVLKDRMVFRRAANDAASQN